MTSQTRWQEIAADVDKRLALVRADEVRTGLCKLLRKLSEAEHCSSDVVGWVAQAKAPKWELQLSKSADGVAARHPAVMLRNLSALGKPALLTFHISFGKNGVGVRSYTAGIQATGWHARVDFDDVQRGQGCCGHPRLHCHVGTDANNNDEFTARAPLAALSPVDAVEWLLAAVTPTMEP